MRLTAEQIKDHLNKAIEEIVDAAIESDRADSFYFRSRRQEYEETRKRVMDALIEIYFE